MEFEDPDWRFSSPGPVPGDVRSSIGLLINSIAQQGHRKTVFEIFKRRFAPLAGATYALSTNEGWAETDLDEMLDQAYENEAPFIEALYDGCQDLRQQLPELSLPNEAAISLALKNAGSRFQISGGRLEQRGSDGSDATASQATQPSGSGSAPSGAFGAAAFGEVPFGGGEAAREDHAEGPAGVPSDGIRNLNSADDFTRNLIVARATSTPGDVLAALANSVHAEVREAVAGNRSTSPSVLESLARDQVADVRAAVQANAATPPHILTWLESDPDSDIRKAAGNDPRNPFNGSMRGGAGGHLPAAPRLVVDGREEIETPIGYVRLYVRPVTDRQVAGAVSRNRAQLAASLSLLIDALNAFLSAHNVLDADLLEKLREIRLRAEEFRAAVPAALDGNLNSAVNVGKTAGTLVRLTLATALGFVGGVGSGIGDGVLKLVTSASADAAAQVCVEVNPELIEQLAKYQADRRSQ